MRILIAPDSFKGSLSAAQAAAALADGFRRGLPDAEYDLLPVADGGEGSMSAWLAACGGHTHTRNVTGPCGHPLEAGFARLADARTAVVELAAASGLAQVPPAQRDPLLTTTHGTGELIATAMDAGCERIIVALGGSATIDGGIGLLQALGVRFTDTAGDLLPAPLVGGDLERVVGFDPAPLERRLQQWRGTLTLACDVDNPLLGSDGAVSYFGTQKGATAASGQRLETALGAFYTQAESRLGRRVRERWGAGAAGGAAAALMLFCRAQARAGFELLAVEAGVAARIAQSDLVVTGEGRLDRQTARGKAPARLAAMARAQHKPVIAVCGSVADDGERDSFALVEAAGTALPATGEDARADLVRAAERAALACAALLNGAPATSR